MFVVIYFILNYALYALVRYSSSRSIKEQVEEDGHPWFEIFIFLMVVLFGLILLLVAFLSKLYYLVRDWIRS